MFDLIFTGRLLPGADPRHARLRLTAFFRLTDPADVELFFRGGEVILRRALPQAEAQSLCERLIAGGLDCRLQERDAAVRERERDPEPAPEPDPGIRPGGDAATLSAAPPNLFQIRSDRPRQRVPDADAAQLRFLASAMGTGIAGVVFAAAMLTRLFWWSPGDPVSGPESIVAAADGTLYMLAANQVLVHNRGGGELGAVSAEALGLSDIDRLLDAAAGALYLSAAQAGDQPVARRPWRCTLEAASGSGKCAPLTARALAVESLAGSGLSDALFAVTADWQLLRISDGAAREHAILADSAVAPRLINHRGLLLVNSGEGPGLGVYRPDTAAFGQQLDEILLLHPEAVAREQQRVVDFALTAETSWVLLADDKTAGLYAFDATWAPLQAVNLPNGFVPAHLASWRDRLLVYTPEALQVQRVRPDGQVEAPLVSDSLRALAARARLESARGRQVFALVLLALGIAVAAGAVLTWMTWHLRAGFTDLAAQPAFLLEHHLQRLRWWPCDPRRRAADLRWVMAAAAALTILLASAFLRQVALTYIALPLLFLTLAALRYLRTPAPQIGLRGGELALVDHRGVYQTGECRSFKRCGPFILRGGVLVCLGLPGLPGRSDPFGDSGGASPLKNTRAWKHCHPARVLYLLLQSRHPVIALALAIPAGLVTVSCIALVS